MVQSMCSASHASSKLFHFALQIRGAAVFARQDATVIMNQKTGQPKAVGCRVVLARYHVVPSLMCRASASWSFESQVPERRCRTQIRAPFSYLDCRSKPRNGGYIGVIYG